MSFEILYSCLILVRRPERLDGNNNNNDNDNDYDNDSDSDNDNCVNLLVNLYRPSNQGYLKTII